MTRTSVIYAYSLLDGEHAAAVALSSVKAPAALPLTLSPDCDIFRKLAIDHLRPRAGGAKYKLLFANLSTRIISAKERTVTLQDIVKALSEEGYQRVRLSGGPVGDVWVSASKKDVVSAWEGLWNTLEAGRGSDGKKSRGRGTRMADGHLRGTHGAADALDWEEAMSLVRRMEADGEWRDAMLVACGCFLGLRISDLLRLRWNDICSEGLVSITEKKTGKNRLLKVNNTLQHHAELCRNRLGNPDGDSFIFGNPKYGSAVPFTRQRADQILKKAKQRYGIRSAGVFSTHSLRKTFGRRVWMQESRKGQGERALLLLCDVFGHSSMAITKRYLGIRQDEILSVYDSLSS